MILQGILSLISGFKRIDQKDFHTGRICTAVSPFSLCCKRKTVIWQIRKYKRAVTCCLLRKKIYNKKSKHTFYETFFSLWMTNWCKQYDKKIKIPYVLKKLLVKTIIVFTSIYFESCCEIPAQSNKSIP